MDKILLSPAAIVATTSSIWCSTHLPASLIQAKKVKRKMIRIGYTAQQWVIIFLPIIPNPKSEVISIAISEKMDRPSKVAAITQYLFMTESELAYFLFSLITAHNLIYSLQAPFLSKYFSIVGLFSSPCALIISSKYISNDLNRSFFLNSFDFMFSHIPMRIHLPNAKSNHAVNIAD